jgi:copper(I)-binding protein
MRRASVLGPVLLTLIACSPTPPAAPTASDGWVRLAPPGASAHAGYLRLHNPTAVALRCDRASSPDFGAAELHRSVLEDGRSRMLREQTVEVPAHGEALLQPGDYHLMLFRPARELSEGTTATVTLHCGETAVDAVLTVRKS